MLYKGTVGFFMQMKAAELDTKDACELEIVPIAAGLEQ